MYCWSFSSTFNISFIRLRTSVVWLRCTFVLFSTAIYQSAKEMYIRFCVDLLESMRSPWSTKAWSSTLSSRLFILRIFFVKFSPYASPRPMAVKYFKPEFLLYHEKICCVSGKGKFDWKPPPHPGFETHLSQAKDWSSSSMEPQEWAKHPPQVCVNFHFWSTEADYL